MTDTFKFATRAAKQFGYIPQTPSGYLGLMAYYYHSTKGLPPEFFKIMIEKNIKAWMKFAAIELWCLTLLKEHKHI